MHIHLIVPVIFIMFLTNYIPMINELWSLGILIKCNLLMRSSCIQWYTMAVWHTTKLHIQHITETLNKYKGKRKSNKILCLFSSFFFNNSLTWNWYVDFFSFGSVVTVAILQDYFTCLLLSTNTKDVCITSMWEKDMKMFSKTSCKQTRKNEQIGMLNVQTIFLAGNRMKLV